MGGVKGNISEKIQLACKINPLNVVLNGICKFNHIRIIPHHITYLAHNIHYTPNSIHNYETTRDTLLYFPFKNEHSY